MLFALLTVLGVGLPVVVPLLAAMLGRRRRLARQPGALRGAALLIEGEAKRLRRRWRGGYGRRVRNAFVWPPAPLLLRTVLLPVDAVNAARPLACTDVRRPRGLATAATFTVAHALFEVALREQDEPSAFRPSAADGAGARLPHSRRS